MQFRTAVLPNGLQIVAECHRAAYSTALGFFVRTGARDETDETAGVSHFLEHMAFKGTATRSADDVNREFDEMGAHYNAATSEENTVFYAAVLPEYQGRAMALLADILRPALRREDFDLEKNVILEEIQMYEDQPPFGADEKCRALWFGSHPLARSVLGTQESIRQLPVEAMQEYFRCRYAPGNIILAAAGRIDFDTLVADAQQACGEWPPLPCRRDMPQAVPRTGFHVLARPTASQQYVLQLAAGPSATDPDRYAAKVLAMVLGDDSGSRLYWELVDPGLAEQAELSHCEFEGAGALLTYLSCDPDQAEENLARVAEVYRVAAVEGIAPEELQQAKNKARSRMVLSSERPRNRLFAVGSDWMYRQQYRTLEEDLDLLAAVRTEDLADVLARYRLDQCLTLSIGPMEE